MNPATPPPVPPRIVAVVAERTNARALAEARLAGAAADLLEWRLDALEEEPDLAAWTAAVRTEWIATCRPGRRGDAERPALLAAAGRAGAAWLDLECGEPAPGDRGAARVLRSLHLREGEAGDAAAVAGLARLEREGGDLLKLVLPESGALQGLAALRLLKKRRRGKPLACHALGPANLATRVLGPVFGSALLYAATRPGREVVPGMPSLGLLHGVYGVRRLRRGSPFLALVGGRLDHSVSPWTMNAALRAGTAGAVYVPVPGAEGLEIGRALMDLGAALVAFTIPHKEVALAMGDEPTPAARRARSANTLFRRAGKLVADNTDGPAAAGLAAPALGGLAGKTVLVLGNGGTARAVAAALLAAGARVWMKGRDEARTLTGADACGATAGLPPGPVDMLLNATAAGQWPETGEDPAEALAPGVAAPLRFDAVYNPRETRFLAAGRAAGAKTIAGLDMLVAQGAAQVRLAGLGDPDLAAMRRVGEEELARRERPIVLLGMRGVGKSAVAAEISARTGRVLLDTDAMVEETAGMSVAEVFVRRGEAEFRRLEEQVVRAAIERPGTVVALGGGAAVHLPQPVAGATVVWLRARPETLATRVRGSGRPSLRGKPVDEEVAALLAEREPLYRARASVTLDTDDLTPAEAAAEVLSGIDPTRSISRGP